MANTQHGMLVAFGEFLGQHGLIDRLMQVPLGQKTRTFTPRPNWWSFWPGLLLRFRFRKITMPAK